MSMGLYLGFQKIVEGFSSFWGRAAQLKDQRTWEVGYKHPKSGCRTTLLVSYLLNHRSIQVLVWG